MGGAIGGFLALSLVIGAALWFFWRQRQYRLQHGRPGSYAPAGNGDMFPLSDATAYGHAGYHDQHHLSSGSIGTGGGSGRPNSGAMAFAPAYFEHDKYSLEATAYPTSLSHSTSPPQFLSGSYLSQTHEYMPLAEMDGYKDPLQMPGTPVGGRPGVHEMDGTGMAELGSGGKLG